MWAERLAVLLPPLAAAPLLYATARLVEAGLGTPVDPATVFWTTPISLFHRFAFVGYASLLAVLVTHVIARRDPSFPLRAAHVLLPLSTVAIVLQALFVP